MAVRAKKAIYDLFAASATPGGGGTFAALAAANQWPAITIRWGWMGGDVGTACIYGGGWRFTADDGDEEGTLSVEKIVLTWYVRFQYRPVKDVMYADLNAEAIADTMATLLVANRRLTPAVQYATMSSGLGDYSANNDESVVIHQYSVTVDAINATAWNG